MKITKKSSKWFRLGAILMSVSLITCYVLSSTLAKYTSAYYGADSARVAKFSFGAAGLGADGTTIDLFATMFDDQVLDTNGTNEDISGDKLIAPGTQGSFNLVFTGNAEVDAALAFDINDGTVLEDYLTRPDIIDEVWVGAGEDGTIYEYNYQSSSTKFLPIIYSVQIDGVTKYYSNFFALHTAAAYATIADGIETYGSEEALRENWFATYGPMASSLDEIDAEEIDYQSNELYGMDLNVIATDGFFALSTLDMARLIYVLIASEHNDGRFSRAILTTYDVGTCTVTLPETNEQTTITISGSLADMGKDLSEAVVEAGTDYSTKNVTVNWFWAYDAVPSEANFDGSTLVWNGQNDEKDTYWANLAAEGTEITSTLNIKVTATQID